MAAVSVCAKEIKAIQKHLTQASTSSSSSSSLSSRTAVDLFRQLPNVNANSPAYLDAILRTGYKQKSFELKALLQFLRGLPNPDHQLNGCWILYEVDNLLLTSDHRQHSLGLAFFIYELKQKLQQSPLKIRVDQFWREWYPPAIHAIVLGHPVTVKTFAHNEFMYAPADDLRFDHERRRVFTWKETASWQQPRDDELEPKWRFVPGNSEKSWFYIVSARYANEHLYAANVQVKDEHSIAKDYAFSWCAGNPGEQAQWELHAVSRDVFTFFNKERNVYLFAAPDQHHDDQRRLVLALAEDKATEENKDARKWRLMV